VCCVWLEISLYPHYGLSKPDPGLQGELRDRVQIAHPPKDGGYYQRYRTKYDMKETFLAHFVAQTDGPALLNGTSQAELGAAFGEGGLLRIPTNQCEWNVLSLLLFDPDEGSPTTSAASGIPSTAGDFT